MFAILTTTACTRPAPQHMEAREMGPVKITQFYASPPNPPLGEKTLVCYGVENASEVRIDPPVERLWPAIARCFDFVTGVPAKLTLKAARSGQEASQTIEIVPGPPAVKLLEVSINKLAVAPGEEVMVCYKAKNAASATIEWGEKKERNPGFGCITDHPKHTTTYTVSVTGAGGDTDTERVTATVK